MWVAGNSYILRDYSLRGDSSQGSHVDSSVETFKGVEGAVILS